MLASMTAFGRMEETGVWGNAIWEIRTVNHRYLDMVIRLPDELRMLEPAIRETISARIKRGKVDCTLRIEPGTASSMDIPVNRDLVDKLLHTAENLPITSPGNINPIDVLRWPGVINKEALDLNQMSDHLLSLLIRTLDNLVETRSREGEKIKSMIIERCDKTAQQVNQVRSQIPEIMEGVRQRYLSRAQELNNELDNERLEQEMLLLAQKMDVEEEIDRLQAHIEEVRRVLNENQPVGRRLDFLMQEMNREANTLGSKSVHIDTTNSSVELKVLIEQMREQIQNIE